MMTSKRVIMDDVEDDDNGDFEDDDQLIMMMHTAVELSILHMAFGCRGWRCWII